MSVCLSVIIIIIIIFIIIVIIPYKLCTIALVDGFSLESKWQQGSSRLQESSQHSGLPQ